MTHTKMNIPAERGGVDDQTFRSIMSAFPTGVTVVTTVDENGKPYGLTCNATCSVSKDPPMLLICVNSTSRVLKAILRRNGFIVNFLRDNRGWMSNLFASKQEERFTSITWQPSRLGKLPWMPLDTIAYAECEVTAAIDAGDHVIVIGAVVDGHAEQDHSGPLMYWRRSYAGWPFDEDAVTAAMTLATEG